MIFESENIADDDCQQWGKLDMNWRQT